MSPDSPPYDVDFARLHTFAELEGGSAVWCPRHLIDVSSPFDSANAQPRPQRSASFEILDKPCDRGAEPSLVLGCECSEIAPESAGGCPRRHGASGALGQVVQEFQECG
jgi:hypothetical protein